jgi:hypothetical protein
MIVVINFGTVSLYVDKWTAVPLRIVKVKENAFGKCSHSVGIQFLFCVLIREILHRIIL